MEDRRKLTRIPHQNHLLRRQAGAVEQRRQHPHCSLFEYHGPETEIHEPRAGVCATHGRQEDGSLPDDPFLQVALLPPDLVHPNARRLHARLRVRAGGLEHRRLLPGIGGNEQRPVRGLDDVVQLPACHGRGRTIAEEVELLGLHVLVSGKKLTAAVDRLVVAAQLCLDRRVRVGQVLAPPRRHFPHGRAECLGLRAAVAHHRSALESLPQCRHLM